ncbi:MAG: branched-chain amino acid ABC transporter permease [Mucispirillum sp.]|nr:branched-chain amino acid ABC transporter permease [Mucispirillum sp.]
MVFVSFAFVLLVYWLVVSRVKSTNAGGNSRINALISAIGMSMILSNMVMLLRGTSDQPYRMGFFTGTINIGSFSVSSLQIFIIVFSFILMGILFYIIHKTKFGLSMRAVSHNLNAARLMGINPDKVIAMTFVIGSALAGVAGVLVGTYYQSVSPNIGMMYGLKAFVAAVLGGIGSIPGAVVGGIVLGIAEVVGIAFLSSSYKDAIAFGILILILIIKPTGIFGKTMKEKV